MLNQNWDREMGFAWIWTWSGRVCDCVCMYRIVSGPRTKRLGGSFLSSLSVWTGGLVARWLMGDGFSSFKYCFCVCCLVLSGWESDLCLLDCASSSQDILATGSWSTALFPFRFRFPFSFHFHFLIHFRLRFRLDFVFDSDSVSVSDTDSE